MRENIKKYDYIFCGMGASSSLLIGELSRQNLFKGKNILIVEKNKKNKNDKTFCFWAKNSDDISENLKHIISKTWNSVQLDKVTKVSIFPYLYHHIESIDLYNKSLQIAEKYKFDVLLSEVSETQKDENGLYIIVNNQKIRSTFVFDSRPPDFEVIETKSHLYQSFVGWTIQLPNHTLDFEAFTLMDFSIQQGNATQFVYILPFSSSQALVEVTRFGKEIINKQEAEGILKKYISFHFGKYEKINTEIGCIPMSHYKILRSEIPGLIHLGARNYNTKASTGYTFKNMYYHAQSLAIALKKNEDINTYNKYYHAIHAHRFSWYDSLLLDVLNHSPEHGTSIFLSMLQKIPIQDIFRFLDQETQLREEVGIFFKLPWKPFLRIILKRIISSPYFHPLILIFFVSLLIFLGKYTPYQSEVGYFLLCIGMVSIGIPHGAVDHLLETNTWNIKKAPIFILRYLLLASIIGLLWYFFPQGALIIFLVYSMWHFGQVDGKIWGFSNNISFLWGISLLIYILGTHLEETNQIITALGSQNFPFEIPIFGLLPWIIWGVYHKSLPFLFTIFWLTLTSFVPLLFAFGIYFIAQHSITGWSHIKKYLNKSSKDIWIESLPFHLGAWILLLGFYFFWPIQVTEGDFGKWGIFFIFLACLSFPHIIAMHLMYRKSDIS